MSRTERITVRVSPDQKARLKRFVEQSEYDGMSDALSAQIDALVEADDGSDPDGHYPEDDQLRSLYVTALEIADEFRLVMKRHRSALARESGVAKSDLEDVLAPLRRQGFVARPRAPAESPRRARRPLDGLRREAARRRSRRVGETGGAAGMIKPVAIDTTMLLVALGLVAAVVGTFVAYAAVRALSLVFGARSEYR